VEQILVVVTMSFIKKIQFSNYVFWFPKECFWGKFKKRWYGLCIIQYFLPNNIVLLVTLGKFEFNYELVNVNKFKPFKYVD
jgi:hypothetical protein